MRRLLAVLMGALLATPAFAQSTPPAAPARACVVVFGQGRNFSDTQMETNLAWNKVNQAFHGQVVNELVAGEIPAVSMLLPVQARDLQANVSELLARVERDSCDRVLETAVFADPEAELLVARVRLYPIVRIPHANAVAFDGKVPSVGKVLYTSQRDFQLTQRNLDRLVPTVLATEMVAEWLKSPVR
jgi:hypothetical protein